jgi:DNA repair protein RadD
MLKPRQYQRDAIDCTNKYLRENKGNPCIELPTGSGKSLVIALMIHEWKQKAPNFRVCILAHRTYLVEQNSEESANFYNGTIGLYSAKLRKRDNTDIVYASIDSIHKKWNEFTFDVLIIDEAQYISPREKTRYQNFIQGCKRVNKNLRVIGLTATPYRLKGGSICGENSILNEIVYRADVGDLIEQGYLCPLRSKVTAKLDLSGVKKTAQDYNLKDLALAVDTDDIVKPAVANMLDIVVAEKRKSIIIFCIDVAHAMHVNSEIQKAGYESNYVTSKQSDSECDELIQDFKDRKFNFFVSVNKFLEGFNVKHIDCIVMMRPTKSKGLWIQAVGRGLRLHESKEYCLVLDYGNNIEEHGCIDEPPDERQRIRVCEDCREVFTVETNQCPSCGWQVPKKEIQREEGEAKERERLHEIQAAQAEILRKQQEPTWHKVDLVTTKRHVKVGSYDSMKVTYFAGVTQFSEWICPNHEGYAGNKAKQWLATRGIEHRSVDECLTDMFINQRICEKTKEILVKKEGKHFKILSYRLNENKITYDER